MLAETPDNLLILMLFFGFVIGVSLYSLMFYYWGRITAFLYYGIFVIAVGVFAGLLGGITELLPFELSDSAFYWSHEIVSTIFSIAFLQFARLFIDTKNLHPRLDQAVLATIVLLILLPNYYSGTWVLVSIGVNLLTVAAGLSLAYAAWFEYKKGKTYIIFMLVSMLIMAFTFLSDALLYGLSTQTTPSIGHEYMQGNRLIILCAVSMIEMVMFSISIAGLFGYTQQQKEVEEQINKTKTRFFAAASHDLRQPLHALSLFNQKLAGTDDPLVIKPLVKKISHSLDSMNQLFESLLASSRLEAGVEEVHKETVFLQPIVECLRDEFDLQAEAKNVNLRFQTGDISIETDPILLERILRNLLANAITYMDKTEGGRVDFSFEKTRDLFQLVIRDNGPGMSQAQIAQAFGEFSRLENSYKQAPMGSGLGLSIVKRTANLMGCTINVESTVGVGTTFELKFRL